MTDEQGWALPIYIKWRYRGFMSVNCLYTYVMFVTGSLVFPGMFRAIPLSHKNLCYSFKRIKRVTCSCLEADKLHGINLNYYWPICTGMSVFHLVAFARVTWRGQIEVNHILEGCNAHRYDQIYY